MVIFLVVIVITGLVVMAEGAGKKIVVVGKGINIRKWFVINDAILLNDLTKFCD